METPDPRHTGVHPKSFLRPCALLLLDEQPACGYELRARLRPFNVPWDAGTIYRVLNSMEDEGLVSSRWERSNNGPQRRRYDLTDQGRAVLGGWADQLNAMRELITGFLDRYERDVEAHAAMLAGATPAGPPPAEPAGERLSPVAAGSWRVHPAP